MTFYFIEKLRRLICYQECSFHQIDPATTVAPTYAPTTTIPPTTEGSGHETASPDSSTGGI